MTVTVTNPVAGPFTPNSATVAFPFTFKVGSVDEVQVVQVLAGASTVLSDGLYDVSLNADEGGTVTFTVAPLTGSGDLYIASDPDFSESTNFTGEGGFNPKSLNSPITRAAVRDIYLKARLDRLLPFDAFLGITLAGKYLAWDAGGVPFASSGTGADAGLRDDLAEGDGGLIGLGGGNTLADLSADDGSTIVFHKRSAASALDAVTYQPLALHAGARSMREKADEIVSVTDWSAYPNLTDQAVNLQRAIDECPMGCTLFFPSPIHADYRYVTSVQLDVRRRINLMSDGGARLHGDFGSGDTTSDLLNINHLNPQDADSRGWWIEGFRGISKGNGRHAINIYTGGGSVFNGNFRIANIREIVVADDSAGVAINLYNAPGCELQHAAIEHCYVTNGIRLNDTTDGIKLVDVKSGGMKTGLIVDLRPGAFVTVIENCLFTNRDGGVIINNADFLFIDRCHFEQFVNGAWGTSVNQSSFGAQLLINGEDPALPCRNIVVSRTNFGGGTNCETPVVLAANTRDVVFDACQWRRGASGYDVSILAASAKGTVFDPIQFANGVRSSPDPGWALRVLDDGTATRGIPNAGADLTFQNSWTAGSDMGWSVDPAGRVHLDGSIIAGTGTLNQVITTLPEGYRPRLDTTLTCSNATDNSIVRIRVMTTGEVQLAGAAPTAGTPVFLNVSYWGKVRDTYETGVV